MEGKGLRWKEESTGAEVVEREGRAVVIMPQEVVDLEGGYDNKLLPLTVVPYLSHTG